MQDLQELERAISRHLDNERLDLNPLYSETLIRTAKIYIKTMENAPRDYEALSAMIKQKEAAMEKATDCFEIDVLDTECEALDRLRGIVQAYEMGRNLDTIAY